MAACRQFMRHRRNSCRKAANHAVKRQFMRRVRRNRCLPEGAKERRRRRLHLIRCFAPPSPRRGSLGTARASVPRRVPASRGSCHEVTDEVFDQSLFIPGLPGISCFPKENISCFAFGEIYHTDDRQTPIGCISLRSAFGATARFVILHNFPRSFLAKK